MVIIVTRLKRLMRACVPVVVAACPTMAFAQANNGFYVRAAGGAAFGTTATSSTKNTKLGTDTGGMGVVDLGWRFAMGLRIEVEGNFRDNGVDRLATRRVDGKVLNTSNAGGGVQNYGTMVNALYEVNLSRYNIALRPYFGGGIGVNWEDFNDVRGAESARFNVGNHTTVLSDPSELTFSKTRAAFAYQAIVGVAYPLPMVKGLDVTLEGRYVGHDRVKADAYLVSTLNDRVNGVIPSSHGSGRFGDGTGSILGGLRYDF